MENYSQKWQNNPSVLENCKKFVLFLPVSSILTLWGRKLWGLFREELKRMRTDTAGRDHSPAGKSTSLSGTTNCLSFWTYHNKKWNVRSTGDERMLTLSPSQRKTQWKTKQNKTKQNKTKQNQQHRQKRLWFIHQKGWLQIKSSATLLRSIKHGKY